MGISSIRRLGICLALTAILAASAPADIWSRAFGPKGSLMISRPVLRWQVWAEGASMARATCTINGRPVTAIYSASERQIESRAPEGLPAGRHHVAMTATTDDGLTVRKEWEFEIRPDALSGIPQPTAVQEETLAFTNEWRRRCGLAPMVPEPVLFAAADHHAQYLARNATTGHYQTEGTPGFFGSTPTERLQAFGFIDGHFEVVQYGRMSPIEAVLQLIAAPYHRIPFLQPGSPPFGGGVQKDRVVLEMGQSAETETVVYPYDGQRDVPLLWRGIERPNPLRLHRELRMPTGYPIMLVHFAERDPKFVLQSARLRTALGQEVPICVNHSGNDTEMQTGAILIPVAPLEPGTTYVAEVVGALEDGRSIRRQWDFTTRR